MNWHAKISERLDEDATAMVDLLRTLVRVPSVGGSEAEYEIQALLADWLRDNDFEVDHWQIPLADLAVETDFPGAEVGRDQAWGLVGRLPGSGDGPSLMFNGHVDVVPTGDPHSWRKAGPFDGTVIGDRLFGRGACDMKAGLVAALFAARALRRSGVRLAGDVIVACVMGEEDGGLGTYGLLRRGWRADACVITEPTGLGIVPANGGALTFRLRVQGLSSHASTRTAGVSAVELFWPVFSALRDLEAARNRVVDPLMERWEVAYPIEIGTVTAGDWSSSVPDLLVAEGRLGVALGEDVEAAQRAFTEAVSAACQTHPWLRTHPVGIQWWGGQFAAARLPRDRGRILDNLQSAHTTVTGSPADIWGAPYGSDLRLLTELGGVPTVQYGPGEIEAAHASDESVPLPQLFTAARTLAATAIEHCGTQNRSDSLPVALITRYRGQAVAAAVAAPRQRSPRR